MPRRVELVRLSMLRVRDGVMVPSVESFGRVRLLECASRMGVAGADGGSEGSSKARPRGGTFSDGASPPLRDRGWLMVLGVLLVPRR